MPTTSPSPSGQQANPSPSGPSPSGHQARKHKRLSGSKVERALLCAGSVQLEATVPDPGAGEAALRGTAIHEIADALLSGKPVPAEHQDKPQEWIDEAQEYATALTEYVQPWAKKTFVELCVDQGLGQIHAHLGGTADFVAIGAGRLLVADLKTGRIDVQPHWSAQLMTYALGVVLQLKAPPSINVTLAIYQDGKLKTWDCAYPDLMDWMDTLTDLSARVWADKPLRSPSADACRWCRAKSVCPELSDKAKQIATLVANQDFGIVQPEGSEAPVVKVPHITTDMLDMADLLQAWIDDVREKAKRQLIDGQEIVGWRMRPGRRMVQIIDIEKAERMAQGVKEAWTLKTPSALQKLGVLPSSLFREVNAAGSLVKVDK